jgi:hypothetical protein
LVKKWNSRIPQGYKGYTWTIIGVCLALLAGAVTCALFSIWPGVCVCLSLGFMLAYMCWNALIDAAILESERNIYRQWQREG